MREAERVSFDSCTSSAPCNVTWSNWKDKEEVRLVSSLFATHTGKAIAVSARQRAVVISFWICRRNILVCPVSKIKSSSTEATRGREAQTHVLMWAKRASSVTCVFLQYLPSMNLRWRKIIWIKNQNTGADGRGFNCILRTQAMALA